MCVGYSRENLIPKCRGKKNPKNPYKTQPLSTIKKNYFHTSRSVPYFLPASKDPKQLPKDCLKIHAVVFPARKP